MEAPSLAEIGVLVARRRCELGMGRGDLARLARVATRTVANLELARTWPRAPTRHRIEAVLGWPRGSIDAAREGRATLDPPASPTIDFSTLGDDELWTLIEPGRLDANHRQEAVDEYERRQVRLLAQRLDTLSRHGLTATSRYIEILLTCDPSEGFRRPPGARAWSDYEIGTT